MFNLFTNILSISRNSENKNFNAENNIGCSVLNEWGDLLTFGVFKPKTLQIGIQMFFPCAL
jgi:hypothetical protein